jgi:hypothetical protein
MHILGQRDVHGNGHHEHREDTREPERTDERWTPHLAVQQPRQQRSDEQHHTDLADHVHGRKQLTRPEMVAVVGDDLRRARVVRREVLRPQDVLDDRAHHEDQAADPADDTRASKEAGFPTGRGARRQ